MIVTNDTDFVNFAVEPPFKVFYRKRCRICMRVENCQPIINLSLFLRRFIKDILLSLKPKRRRIDVLQFLIGIRPFETPSIQTWYMWR